MTKRVPAEDGYVRSRIDGVDKRLDPRRLSVRLGDTYRPLILRAELKISIIGARVEPPPINFQEEHRISVYAADATVRAGTGSQSPKAVASTTFQDCAVTSWAG